MSSTYIQDGFTIFLHRHSHGDAHMALGTGGGSGGHVICFLEEGVSVNGQVMLAAFAPIRGTRWSLVIQVPKADYSSYINGAMLIVISSTLAVRGRKNRSPNVPERLRSPEPTARPDCKARWCRTHKFQRLLMFPEKMKKERR